MNYRIKNIDGKYLFNDFPKNCDKCIDSCISESIKLICPIYKDERRIGKKANDFGNVFACSNNYDICNSSKTFKNKQDAILLGISEIDSIKEKLNIDLQKQIHNLTKTNGHNIQELYAIVPQEMLNQNINSQIEYIESKISENPKEAAKMFLRIAKNNASMKAEFSAINKLSDGKNAIKNRRHPIKKVVLNTYHIFSQDFKEKNILVQFDDNNDYLIFDYEILQASLYHLFHNATKYALSNTSLFVKFQKDSNDFSIMFEMISLKINPEERKEIFEDGKYGIFAKKSGKAGKGLGLGTTSKMLELCNCELHLETNSNLRNSKTIRGLCYEENIFTIKFKNYTEQTVS